jgi:hypothetical protein
MSEPKPAHQTPQESGRRIRPAPLLFEPEAAVSDPEHFFGLESMDDPQELLARSTELALAFQAAADRATEFQAIAAAQLADPKHFDRMPVAGIAQRAKWSEDYAKKMIEFGVGLLKQEGPRD